MGEFVGNQEFQGFQSLFDELWQTFSSCEAKILECQKVCSDCKLLLEPWPVEVDEECCESGSRMATDATTSENNSEQPNNNPGKETLPHEVIEEINRADALLAKAEKVVNQHLKKEEQTVEKKRKPLAAVTKPNKPTAKKVTEPQSACISQTKLNHLLKKANSDPKALKPTARPTSSKFKPVHLSAPFKTQPDVSRKKRIKPASRPGTENQRFVEQHPAGQAKLDVRAPSRNSKVLSRRESLERTQEAKISLVQPEVRDRVENWIENTSIEETQSKAPVTEQAVKEEALAKPHQFCLLKEGRNLTVPSQLRRAALQNSVLQKKICSAYTSEQMELLDLINFHCAANAKLAEMLQSIPRTGIEHRDAREICKLKEKLNFFQSQFVELDAASASILDALPHSAIPTIPTLDIRHDNHLRWLPCQPDHYHCSAINISPVTYRSREEMFEWMTLHHEAQLLLLKSHLLDLMAPQCFALLANCQEKEMFPVYRGIHHLLCSLGGSEFPVLVSGDVGGDDDSSDDS
ncbi:hypothetical protein CAPTEDRAFT_201134 [Capitella teleta]|uniref:Uncharacterized protein n=1 Tax=Capitella teleta TaxID=283909 RepID=R7VHG1_CAPTE|nr:hypothetical protein CAPTEDRAFT_201134 [Capitella teleta]|eukprot:ELU15716.1 hypothetical protein CAPTEDRAFT_201134 [Capitella teleta]